MDEPYKASLVNIYKDRAIVDAECCATDLELVGVHSRQVIHDVQQEKVKRCINMIFIEGWTLVSEFWKHLE